MKHCKAIFFLTIFFSLNNMVSAQNTRTNVNNNIGWYGYFGTFKLTKKVSLHTEYQWRRENIITEWQQSLLRTGVNYQVNPKLQLRLGYAWVETFPYGTIPINGLGKDFTEHRTFQMATITDKIAKVDLSHRFILEQRWVGRYTNVNLTKEDEYLFLNRMRYMFRMQMPLKGETIANKTPYLALYDEIFVGFGKNVNENIFDQNRLGVLLGYKVNNQVRLELGYLNQILQLGREVNGSNVFQHNNGIILNAIFNFDLTKKSE